jgi:hypothetical protein
METSHLSTAPSFRVEWFDIHEASGSYSMLQVFCGRSACGEEFWVRPLWLQPHPRTGWNTWTRMCPHCGMVGWLPGQKPGEQPEPPPKVWKVRARTSG